MQQTDVSRSCAALWECLKLIFLRISNRKTLTSVLECFSHAFFAFSSTRQKQLQNCQFQTQIQVENFFFKKFGKKTDFWLSGAKM